MAALGLVYQFRLISSFLAIVLRIPQQDRSCKVLSGPFFKKKEKAREEKLKKNKGTILMFVKISYVEETEEVSSYNKSLSQVEMKEEVYVEQNKITK